MQASGSAITAWTLVGLGAVLALVSFAVVGPMALSMLHPQDGAAGLAAPAMLLFLPLMGSFVLAGIGIQLLMEARSPR
jgi:uncharacterized membrane protein